MCSIVFVVRILVRMLPLGLKTPSNFHSYEGWKIWRLCPSGWVEFGSFAHLGGLNMGVCLTKCGPKTLTLVRCPCCKVRGKLTKTFVFFVVSWNQGQNLSPILKGQAPSILSLYSILSCIPYHPRLQANNVARELPWKQKWRYWGRIASLVF